MLIARPRFLPIALLALLNLLALPNAQAAELPEPVPLPAFTQAEADAWINSSPLTHDDLKGKITLIEFWTYGCGNCRRSLPWVSSLQEQFNDSAFQIVSVHSPEFAWEKPRTAVVTAVKLHGIQYPVMLDNDFAYWRALGNRYWPAFYLVNQNAEIVGYYIGETHAGDAQAQTIEKHIEKLLGEE